MNGHSQSTNDKSPSHADSWGSDADRSSRSWGRMKAPLLVSLVGGIVVAAGAALPPMHFADDKADAAPMETTARLQSAGPAKNQPLPTAATVTSPQPRPAPALLPAAPQPEKPRVLYLEPPTGDAQETGRIAQLDLALQAETRNEAREHEVVETVHRLLTSDPAGERVDAACGDTFCRLEINKVPGVGMAWHEIDDALQPLTEGETIIQTDARGAVGYVYFAEPDSNLPL